MEKNLYWILDYFAYIKYFILEKVLIILTNITKKMLLFNVLTFKNS